MGLNWTYPHFNVSNLLFLIPLLVKTVNFSQVLSVAMWPCVTPALFFFFFWSACLSSSQWLSAATMWPAMAEFFCSHFLCPQPFPPWSSGQEPHRGGDVIRAHTVPELVCLQSTDPSCSGFLPFPDLLLPALSRVHGSAMTPEKENPSRSHLLTSAGTDGRCCHPGLWDVSPSQ